MKSGAESGIEKSLGPPHLGEGSERAGRKAGRYSYHLPSCSPSITASIAMLIRSLPSSDFLRRLS